MFAVGTKLSHIPATKNIFIDLDESVCDDTCLQGYLDNKEIFSFLSKYTNLSEDDTLKTQFYSYQALFRASNDENTLLKVAVLIPQKSIRRYAISTTNSVIAYMLSKNDNFEIKVFNSVDEEDSSIENAIKELKEQNYQYVIAPVTKKGALNLMKYSQNLLVYIPTLHTNEFEELNSNIIFGGIDYKGQIKKLLSYANEKITLFSDGSTLSEDLNLMVKENVPSIAYEKAINNSKISFKSILKNNKKIDNSSVFLNTPLVKSSLIASQFRVYEREPYILLSTQINYNPLLLMLTQFEDREKLFIANSIGTTSMRVVETNAIFGHNITYDWVNYSTTLGMDYIYSHYLVPTENREFKELVDENQVTYDISIYKPMRYKFVKELFN